jgi:hypothetical protein
MAIKSFLTRSPESTKSEPVRRSLLLQLPAELLRLIYDHLTPDARAALALTCHLFLSIDENVFRKLKDLYPGCPDDLAYSVRTRESYFLRLLERDRRDSSIYVCYSCLKFHSKLDLEPSPPKEVRRFTFPPEAAVGFPECRKTYTEAIAHVYSLLDRTRSNVELKSWIGSTVRPVHMNYQVECGLSDDDLFLLRRFNLSTVRKGRYSKYFMMPSSFLLTSNLEICPHVFFGQDCRYGNSAVYNALDAYYRRQHQDWTLATSTGHAWQPEPFTGFLCLECWLEIDIRFRPYEVRITVWNHVGTLKKEEKIPLSGKIKKTVKLPWARRGFRERVEKNGGLKAGDLEQEWENIPHAHKGSFVGQP